MTLDRIDGSHQDYLLDDSFMLKVVEAASQALWVRVGPVFTGDAIGEKPGIWIEYQEKYMESDLQGALLISPEVWDALDQKIRKQLTEYQSSKYKAEDHPARDCGCAH